MYLFCFILFQFLELQRKKAELEKRDKDGVIAHVVVATVSLVSLAVILVIWIYKTTHVKKVDYEDVCIE